MVKKKKKEELSVRILRGFFKIILVYPAKGIWFLLKKLAEKLQKKKEGSKKGKFKVNFVYSPLEVVRDKSGSLEKFNRKIFSNKSTIGIILGARGTGKSAFGMRLLENFKAKTEKKVYAMGFQPETLPKWIEVINDINQIRNGAVLLVDEGGITFSSRRAMSNANKLLSDILLIARHKDLSVIFITQNSSNLEINAIRQADYLVLKPSSLLQKDFERKKIKQVYSDVAKDFTELKDVLGLTYIYADSYCGFVKNDLPSFWSEGISKSYR